MRPRLIAMVFGLLPGWFVMRSSVLSSWYVGPLLGPMVIFAVPILGVFWLGRRDLRRLLRQELNARGIPICMKCAYDLTSNESGVCPECGTKIEKP